MLVMLCSTRETNENAHRCISLPKEGHTKVVLLLLENGANIKQHDDTARNRLDSVIDNRQKDVARALIEHSNIHLVAPGMKVSQGTRAESLTTPMLKLIHEMPDIAEQVFTDCTPMLKLINEMPDINRTCVH